MGMVEPIEKFDQEYYSAAGKVVNQIDLNGENNSPGSVNVVLFSKGFQVIKS